MTKKPNFGQNIFRKLSPYAISRKTHDPNSRKWQKTSFWVWFTPVGPKLSRQIYFSKIWLHQTLDIIVSYHHVQYQKKLMIQYWENLVTDGRTRVISQDAVRLTSSVQQGHMKEMLFCSHCTTNFESRKDTGHGEEFPHA